MLDEDSLKAEQEQLVQLVSNAKSRKFHSQLMHRKAAPNRAAIIPTDGNASLLR